MYSNTYIYCSNYDAYKYYKYYLIRWNLSIVLCSFVIYSETVIDSDFINVFFPDCESYNRLLICVHNWDSVILHLYVSIDGGQTYSGFPVQYNCRSLWCPRDIGD